MSLPECFIEQPPEPVQFAEVVRRRADEVVFLTRDADGASALRGWGLLAITRPEGGVWSVPTLRPLTGRDVAIVNPDAFGDQTWAEGDAQKLTDTARCVGILTPLSFEGKNPPRNLAEYVTLQTNLSCGPQGLVQEALGCLQDQMPRVAPPDPAAGWPPVRFGDAPDVELFPIDALPKLVADFVRDVADSVGCPWDFVGLPAIITAGAAIGRSTSLLLKPGYFVSASLYGMNVGGPSSGKSPALKAVTQPLWDIDQRLHDDYHREKEAFDRAKQEHQDEGATPLPEPVHRSAALEDCTVEAVASQLANNPRGLMVVRDEGSAWVAGLNQYKSGGRGADRQFWLSALYGATIRVDRKGNSGLVPIRVPHPFLSVCGNLPPEMLGELLEREGRSDGFVERILFAFPHPGLKPYWTERGVPDESKAQWSGVIEHLRARQLMASPEGQPHPQTVTFSPEAKAEWVAWYNAHADEVNAPGFDVSELAVEGKMCDFAARLALIVHLLHLACDPTRGAADPIPPLNCSAIRSALRLWSYFRLHHQRARWFINGRLGNPVARSILDWVKRTKRDHFTIKELTDDLRWLLNRPGEPEAALLTLEDHCTIRKRTDPDRPAGKRGRKSSPVYDVHPALPSR